MTKDEALTLEALKYAASLGEGRLVREMNISPFSIGCVQHDCDECVAREQTQREKPWVSLTKEEIDSALCKYASWYNFAAHLENILKEKNQ